MGGNQLAGGLAQPAFGAIANNGTADAFRSSKADADGRIAVGPFARLNQHRPARPRQALGCRQKLGSDFQTTQNDAPFGERVV